MKNKIFISLSFVFVFIAFSKAQTGAQTVYLDKAKNDTIHRSDIKKNLELKSDNVNMKVQSFNLEVKYTTYVFTESSANNKVTRNMVDIMKYLKGANNYFVIKKLVTVENGVTNTLPDFKVYVID